MDKMQRHELIYAMHNGDGKACSRLIETGGISPSDRIESHTHLHHAAMYGHADVCRVLLAAKAKPNAKERILRWTPLHYAAKYGYAAACQVLLEGKADPNSVDKYGRTPLHNAAGWMHAEVCRVLLQGGANMEVRSKLGSTPVALCFNKITDGKQQSGSDLVNTLRAFLDFGINPNARDSSWTLLHHAASTGHLGACRLLLASGADVNARTDDQRTALHFAAKDGHADICAYLLEAGAKIRARDSEGMTAMAIAKKNAFADVTLALRAKATRSKMERQIPKAKPTAEEKGRKLGSGGGI
jgi:ankyrin repeat protein